jgi:deazaflavin-dependent oxidoreductase (nitroreductase family)
MDITSTDRRTDVAREQQQTVSRDERRKGSPGVLSRWMQRRMNARTNGRVRRGRGTFMGMDVLILHTVGHRSGQPRETPLSWFADGADARLIVASGGGSQDPDWYLNLMAHPERASVELPGGDVAAVTPHRLDGAEREQAWQLITAAQPRYGKYQSKSDREYPVIRLTPR